MKYCAAGSAQPLELVGQRSGNAIDSAGSLLKDETLTDVNVGVAVEEEHDVGLFQRQAGVELRSPAAQDTVVRCDRPGRSTRLCRNGISDA